MLKMFKKYLYTVPELVLLSDLKKLPNRSKLIALIKNRDIEGVLKLRNQKLLGILMEK